MKNKYTLLSKWNKTAAWTLAILISLTFSLYFNRDYLQTKMFGKWVVTSSEMNYDVEDTPEIVTISSHKIGIGNTIVPIKYNSKSTKSTFARQNEKNEIYYYFKENSNDDYYSYLLVFNKEDSKKMLLLSFEDPANNGEINMFTLERSD